MPLPLSEPIVQLKLSEGRMIQTFASVLQQDPDSLFSELLSEESIRNKKLVRLECMHRNKRMLVLIIDCLRRMHQQSDESFLAPEDFDTDDWRALVGEANYWRLYELETKLKQLASNFANTITIGYHSSLSSGSKPSDVNFRRIHRIIVHGQAWVCREVFGHQLNETRDGNVDSDRYTSRFYLTHNFLEQAFDALAANRFRLISSTSNTPMPPQNLPVTTNRNISLQKSKTPAANQTGAHERQFLHYSQFVFVRTS